MKSDQKAEHIILLEHFSIGYQKESVLLSQLNLTVNKGEMVALVGKNGAGKSTLLKSMIGLVEPLDGVCLLDGVPIAEYSIRKRARRVSFVSSQFTQLPSLTVEELVGLGRMPYTDWMGRMTAEDHKKIGKAIEEVQMGAFAGRKLENLSDGERQRAMIARAFVQDTPLMVLDEPTAFLDVPNTFELVRVLSRFRESGRSIVYSTHDLETAIQFADKMWVIHGGRILEGNMVFGNNVAVFRSFHFRIQLQIGEQFKRIDHILSDQIRNDDRVLAFNNQSEGQIRADTGCRGKN